MHETGPGERKSLHELDKPGGGREIEGLEPKLELFSPLDIDRDIELLKKNKEIVCDTDLRDLYVFLNPSGGERKLFVEAPHWRTVSHENIRAMYKSEQGPEFYYTANTKGVGYLKPTLKLAKESIDNWDTWRRIDENGVEGAFGLSDKDDFYADDGDLVLKSKWLTNQGLRTELFSSFGKLKNMYFQGKLTPVRELRQKGVLPSQKLFVPHIGIRLMKMNTRIAEVKESNPERSKELFTKAFHIFNLENIHKNLGFPELIAGDPQSEKIFFETFAKRMGKNAAVFQNLGYIGWQLHSANVTMAAEIIDIGPYQHWKDYGEEEFIREYQGLRRGVWKDMRDIAYGLRFLTQAGSRNGMHIPDAEFLVSSFMDEFSKSLGDNQLEGEGVTRDTLESACHRVMDVVLVERKHLAALKHGADVPDWGL